MVETAYEGSLYEVQSSQTIYHKNSTLQTLQLLGPKQFLFLGLISTVDLRFVWKRFARYKSFFGN